MCVYVYIYVSLSLYIYVCIHVHMQEPPIIRFECRDILDFITYQVVDFACGEHHVICVTSEGQLFEWGDRSWLEPHRVLPPHIDDEELRLSWGKSEWDEDGMRMGWYMIGSVLQEHRCGRIQREIHDL